MYGRANRQRDCTVNGVVGRVCNPAIPLVFCRPVLQTGDSACFLSAGFANRRFRPNTVRAYIIPLHVGRFYKPAIPPEHSSGLHHRPNTVRANIIARTQFGPT
jgi:hypothetical protein